MKFGIDIGHNCYPDIGSSGIRSEDVLNREVGLRVIEKLKSSGQTVINCTPSSATSVGDSLYKRCSTANMNHVEMYVSIHFNTGGSKGAEVFAITDTSKKIAQLVLDNIVLLGYVNRGIKDGTKLYVIRNVNSSAILVECCFIDSREDMTIYNAETMATAISNGLMSAVRKF